MRGVIKLVPNSSEAPVGDSTTLRQDDLPLAIWNATHPVNFKLEDLSLPWFGGGTMTMIRFGSEVFGITAKNIFSAQQAEVSNLFILSRESNIILTFDRPFGFIGNELTADFVVMSMEEQTRPDTLPDTVDPIDIEDVSSFPAVPDGAYMVACGFPADMSGRDENGWPLSKFYGIAGVKQAGLDRGLSSIKLKPSVVKEPEGMIGGPVWTIQDGGKQAIFAGLIIRASAGLMHYVEARVILDALRQNNARVEIS